MYLVQDFDQNFDSNNRRLYLAQRVITNYRLENNLNVQETITFTSLSSRGLGVSQTGPGGKQQLSALEGIKTVTVRKSATNVVSGIFAQSILWHCWNPENSRTVKGR